MWRMLQAGIAAAVVLTASVSVANATQRSASAAPQCGVSRWKVKTLSDHPQASKVNYTPKATTIRTLHKKRPPVEISMLTPRLKGTIEMRVWRLKNVRLIEARRAEDRDIHLVVKDNAGRSMIVEFADPDCDGPVKSKKRGVMRSARNALIAACDSIPTAFVGLQGRATMEGVGFFDVVHGHQRGVAPNGVELHPVLKFSSSNCKRA
jgi:hypothetical protein